MGPSKCPGLARLRHARSSGDVRSSGKTGSEVWGPAGPLMTPKGHAMAGGDDAVKSGTDVRREPGHLRLT